MLIFKKYLLFSFFLREGKGGRKRGRETSNGCLSQAPNGAYSLTGNQPGDLLVHMPALHPVSHTSQGSKCVNFLKNSKAMTIGKNILEVCSIWSSRSEAARSTGKERNKRLPRFCGDSGEDVEIAETFFTRRWDMDHSIPFCLPSSFSWILDVMNILLLSV